MKYGYSDRRAILAKFRRSFGQGVGSIVSLQGGYIQLPLGSVQSDAEQLHSDWLAVGRELRASYENIADTHSSDYGKTDERAD